MRLLRLCAIVTALVAVISPPEASHLAAEA